MSVNIIFTKDLARTGFLRDFVESSTDYLSGQENGDCIVHFTGDYEKYEMHAKLVNGKKEGNAVMLNDGVLYLKLTFADDQLTGSVDRMNKFGFLSLHGNLVNGVERGVFMEYDKDRKVIWKGYYFNGLRFSEITKSASMKGFYEERNVSTGALLSIAQYDEELRDKNGKCFEMLDDEVKREVLYENGVKQRVVREFADGNMLVYDESGEKIYEGAFRGDMIKGYLVHEPMTDMKGFFKTVDATGQITCVSEYEELNVKRNGLCFELEDGKVKRVCVYDKDKLVRVKMEFCGNVMIEYDVNGLRAYEGGFKGTVKSGYTREGEGKEYLDGSKTAVYSGYFRNGKREGLGTEFRGFIPLYSGEWMNGVRHGKGEEMDENGQVVKSGIWVEGVHESEMEMEMVPSTLATTPTEIEELTIADRSWNDVAISELKVAYQHSLRRIQIGNECFGKVKLFELVGVSQLERLEVGEKSFTFNQSGLLGFIGRSDSVCRILNCPKLQSIAIGDHSFEDSETLELKYLFALQSITLGKNCFWWTPSLLLTGMEGGEWLSRHAAVDDGFVGVLCLLDVSVGGV